MREYTKTTKHGESLIHEFASVSEFLDAVEKDDLDKYNSCNWSGGLTPSKAISMARTGWFDHVPTIEKLMLDIDDAAIPVDQMQWQNSVAGYLPNVPAFLSGEPENMMRLSEGESEVGPVRIMVSTFVSQGVSDKDMRVRASAILALVAKIAQMRPTELWMFGEGGTTKGNRHACPMIRVDTAPLDISMAAFALAHTSFTRSLMYGYSRQNMQFNGRWAFEVYESTKREEIMRDVFDLSDDDVLIVGGLNTDESVKNPVKWVNDQLLKFSEKAIA